MDAIIKAIGKTPSLATLPLRVEEGYLPALLTQSGGAMRALGAAILRRETDRPIFVLCTDETNAGTLAADLEALLGESVVQLTGRDLALRDIEVVSRQEEQRRLRALDALYAGALVAVCTVSGLLQRTLPPTALRDAVLTLRLGEEHDLRALAARPKVVAIGEIGLDYYWSGEFVAEQVEAFVSQCRLAARLGLPVAIHTRAAWDDMCRIIGEEATAAAEAGRRLRGVFHAFSEDAVTYRKLKACGDFAFGIGGVVTFRKSKLADTVREMELDDIVLETDCPYLTPAPHRGERNESAYVRFVCEKVAELKGLPPGEVAAATTANAKRIFGI